VAPKLGVTAVSMPVKNDAADIERSIEAFAREPNGGLIVPPDNTTANHRALIAALAARHRLPAIYSTRQFVDARGFNVLCGCPCRLSKGALLRPPHSAGRQAGRSSGSDPDKIRTGYQAKGRN